MVATVSVVGGVGRCSRTWTLYWRDRNLRFHRYNRIETGAGCRSLLPRHATLAR